MRTIFMTMTAVCVMVLCGGCTKDYGEPVTQNFAIGGSYTALDVNHSFEVTVSDQVTDVVVTVGEKAIDKVIVKVKNGTLTIGFPWYTNYDGVATAVIPATANLCDLDISGASSFRGDINTSGKSDIDLSGASQFYGNVVASEVDFDLSGASQYNGTVMADEVDLNLSGASTATMQGTCSSFDLEISGSSHVYAAGLDAQVVEGDLSGSSTADVTCCSKLQVSLSGASRLTYGKVSADCNPVVNCPTSGSSTVTPR